MQDLDQPKRLPAPPATEAPPLAVRRFGRVNWVGLRTLIGREVLRFLKVYGQTLVAPVATSAMFLAVFTFAFAGRRADGAGHPLDGLAFIEFLAPGVVMMAVIQNAFANTSSSVMSAKAQGNIVDTLTPPLSSTELVLGLALGGVARGLAVALLAALALFPFAEIGLVHPLWAIFFALAGSLMLSLLGLAAAIWALKFDHLAAISNFVVTPLSFLSGTFYSVAALPPLWWTISHYNPFFYLIDGFRYGALGISDANPWTGAAFVTVSTAALWILCWRMVETGYRLKS